MSDKTKYNRLAREMFLTEDMAREFVSDTKSSRANQRYADMQMMASDSLLEEGDPNEREVIVRLITADGFDTDPKRFHDTIQKSGKNAASLSSYTLADYQQMKTYMVKGKPVGFAIKTDGDIVSVFNFSDARGIGPILIEAAKRAGGTKLDHYDGFLTGLYKSCGFKIINVLEWSDEYTPDGWEYKKIDINDPDQSVYATEYKFGPEKGSAEWKKKLIQYKSGRPDVIYRKL